MVGLGLDFNVPSSRRESDVVVVGGGGDFNVPSSRREMWWGWVGF